MKIKYLTEYEKEDGMYGGYIFAETLEEAQKIAKEKGEIVVGHIPPNCKKCEKEGELSETI